MKSFISSGFIHFLSVIYLQESIALRPAVLLRKMNDNTVSESVYIDLLECGSKNDTRLNKKDSAEVKQVNQLRHIEQIDMKNCSDDAVEIMKSEMLKLKKNLSEVIIEQIRQKDILSRTILENSILQIQLNRANEPAVSCSSTIEEINESMISCL